MVPLGDGTARGKVVCSFTLRIGDKETADFSLQRKSAVF
jgi:hypothetical protein